MKILVPPFLKQLPHLPTPPYFEKNLNPAKVLQTQTLPLLERSGGGGGVERGAPTKETFKFKLKI